MIPRPTSTEYAPFFRPARLLRGIAFGFSSHWGHAKATKGHEDPLAAGVIYEFGMLCIVGRADVVTGFDNRRLA